MALIHNLGIILTLHSCKQSLSLDCSEIRTVVYSEDDIVARDFGTRAIL
jgi:hypothetical protein